MPSFSRLLDLAARAAEKSAASRSAAPSSGGRDWRDLVRSAADAVSGDRRPAAADAVNGDRRPTTETAPSGPRYTPPAPASSPLTTEDRAAIARYDYLLRTADPDQVERLHREAFERLTPAQRTAVRGRMDAEFAAPDRPRSDAPVDLARAAGRAEARRPGGMPHLLARAGTGALGGAGAVGAGGVLAAVAGGAVVSAVAAPLLAQATQIGIDVESLAAGVDPADLASGTGLAESVSGTVGDLTGEAQETVAGLGEQIGGWGDRIAGFELPGFGDLLGR